MADLHIGNTKSELVAQRDHSENVIEFFTRGPHRWMVAARHASCWESVDWAATCDRARRQLSRHRRLYGISQQRLDAIAERELARAVGTYLGAVAYVEHFFGPQSFLRSCPASEGGYGGWVPNRDGSGAGGWLQFMSSTFYGIIDEALGSARARGMRVLSSTRSWYSPLGQALAGRQMIADGRSGEWEGGTC